MFITKPREESPDGHELSSSEVARKVTKAITLNLLFLSMCFLQAGTGQHCLMWAIRQREQMKKLSGGKEVDERLLFHGTSTSHLHDICAQNFDWRICGTHGTLYGKGSYFARDASYSHRYCHSKTRVKTMIVARVLVGDYVPGNSAYLRPPSRPKQSDCFYDSCVDSLLNPSIFVIFEKHQIYPAYIIEYEQVPYCVVM
ncbi:hypothetical protein JD844_028563 [Phrynosoma platyrhinos]|uniref:Poly [ADP-ribose] polymerase n=1 Tax=Phrynosoma platyrhinos TaxID=52577 RepID=A0ABQ7SI43_PHRPL|nr:hypothetical protein JD844_028563 [Phrynosoma platyrhinos]